MRSSLIPILFPPWSLARQVAQGKATLVTPTTDSGWATYLNGMRLFLPAGTNYCTNPSFEIDTDADGRADGWSDYHTTATTPTYSRVAGIGGRGGYAQRVQYVGVGEAAKSAQLYHYTAVGTFAVGEVATISYLLAGSVAGCVCQITLEARDAAGATLGSVGLAGVTPSVTPTRVSLTSSALPANTSRIIGSLLVSGIDTGDSVDLTIDDVLIEKSPVLTPYFDGTFPNCSWSGAANASTSLRAVSKLIIPSDMGQTALTVAARYTPIGAIAAINNGYVLTHASDRMRLYVSAYRAYLQFNAGAWGINSGLLDWTAGSTHVLVGRAVNAATQDLNHDGTNVAQSATVTPWGGPLDNWSVGNLSDVAGRQAQGHVGPVIISPYRKSNAWVAALQANSGAAFNDLKRLWTEFMEEGDMLIPLCCDGKAYIKRAGRHRSDLEYAFTGTDPSTDTGWVSYV